MNMKHLMEGLEPEWNKNMGLLSSISMSRDISSSPVSWASIDLSDDGTGKILERQELGFEDELLCWWVQASSWQSYSLYNKTSTHSSNEEPRVFMCSASVTRSRTSKKDAVKRKAIRDGAETGSGSEEESRSVDASEVTSRRRRCGGRGFRSFQFLGLLSLPHNL